MTNILGFLRHIHFVGIGGIGMSGIAEVLHNMEFTVSGSDIAENQNIERLRAMGITIYIGHAAENVANADVVVYSSAIKADNPEIVKAHENYIPVIGRGEMLGELTRMTFAIAVGGSHGKTTTTSMVAEILTAAEYDPTTIIGGRLNSTNNNAKLGSSNVMVAEADESDRSFLKLFPNVSVITNIDREHMENYADFDDVKACFAEFANSVPFYGCAVVCLDDKEVSDIIPHFNKRFTTYGIKAQADVKGYNIVKDGFSVSFDVDHKNTFLGRITVNLPGDHIILNSLAAVAVGLEMKVPFSTIADALARFEGVQRRMSVRYKSDSMIVLDDYGHHPTEIAATLKAVREAMNGYKICAVFQPHRYSRTQNLMPEFAKCFFDADYLFVTDIYAASEQPIEGITSSILVNEIKKRGIKTAEYLAEWGDIYRHLADIGHDKLAIITFGAGSITKFSHELSKYFSSNGEAL
ncbi:MAG: UDP-N-acetylmuramate--L-alanine ligase [Deferribacteraceae bacterium]|jgi:UDP-N-acetylmuramate--alanine ligase|nr:UDP-N-acetylmuramate--L-alanine ligase [Deferribacteraceae bacterium]